MLPSCPCWRPRQSAGMRWPVTTPPSWQIAAPPDSELGQCRRRIRPARDRHRLPGVGQARPHIVAAAPRCPAKSAPFHWTAQSGPAGTSGQHMTITACLASGKLARISVAAAPKCPASRPRSTGLRSPARRRIRPAHDRHCLPRVGKLARISVAAAPKCPAKSAPFHWAALSGPASSPSPLHRPSSSSSPSPGSPPSTVPSASSSPSTTSPDRSRPRRRRARCRRRPAPRRRRPARARRRGLSARRLRSVSGPPRTAGSISTTTSGTLPATPGRRRSAELRI